MKCRAGMYLHAQDVIQPICQKPLMWLMKRCTCWVVSGGLLGTRCWNVRLRLLAERNAINFGLTCEANFTARWIFNRFAKVCQLFWFPMPLCFGSRAWTNFFSWMSTRLLRFASTVTTWNVKMKKRGSGIIIRWLWTSNNLGLSLKMIILNLIGSTLY